MPRPNSKKNKAKKSMGTMQLTHTPEYRAKKSTTLCCKNIYFKTIWAAITVISVLLNFYLAYLTLSPKIVLDYNSFIIPDNPISLPLRISNMGMWPIYDVKSITEDKDVVTENNNRMTGNKGYSDICDKLSPNKSKDYIYNDFIYLGDKPIKGTVFVTLQYKLPLISRIITTEPQAFSIYRSKDGYIRWSMR